MRGADDHSDHMFSYVSPESRVRPDHPLRAIRRITDAALLAISPELERRTPMWGGRRFRRSSCCAPWSFRCSTPCEASGS